MDQIPKELYYIVGTLVITKMDVIVDFFKSKIRAEVRVSTLENKIDNLNISLGEVKSKLEKYQTDLNQYFQQLKNKS